MTSNDKLGAEAGKRHAQPAAVVEEVGSVGIAQGSREVASLAGGNVEALREVLTALPGVDEVLVGQMCYPADAVPTGRDAARQAGVLQLRYNPVQLNYAEVLAAFFACHDPTQPREQLPLCQHSTIYFHGPLQEQLARREITQLTAKRRFARPILTEVLPAAVFEPA